MKRYYFSLNSLYFVLTSSYCPGKDAAAVVEAALLGGADFIQRATHLAWHG